MNIKERLGGRRIINAQGHFTVLGGSLLPEPVRDAMSEAAQGYVDMYELVSRAGHRIAELTRNEAAHVCNGASSGIFLAVLACMTRGDRKAIQRLPCLAGLRSELIIHRAHRIPPDLPVLLTGAQWREIGSAVGTMPIELEAAINERTAAIVFMPGEDFQTGALSIHDTIRIAGEHHVPIIIDSAAELPPPDNLWHFTRDLGADLAVFSGGKALCGPQSSGFIVGRADLVETCRLIGAPNNTVARAMKVGKEEINGVVAALEWFLGLDHIKRKTWVVETLDAWERDLNGFSGVCPIRTRPAASYQWEWRIRVGIDAELCGVTAESVRAQLWDRDPRIAVMLPPHGGEIQLTPYTICPGEEAAVSEALTAIFRCAESSLV
jgi:D-glucosaminate-6-phosphate ammonia-lyase